jgi:excisionase family DNA binding protein
VSRLPSPWRVKLHRSYSVEQAAKALNVHKNTVRRWIKDGLPTVGGRGQTLILGSELRTFLEARRKRAKRPCPPGFMFCLKCREPRPPAGRMIDYVPLAATSGNLIGLCPKCFGLMFRRTKQADVTRFQAALVGSADAPIAASKRARSALPEL